jgi:hypothetical protein
LPCIGNQPSDKIDRKVSRFAATSMLNLGNVFELVVDGFNEVAFTQEKLILEFHQAVFHVFTDAGNEFKGSFKALLNRGGET